MERLSAVCVLLLLMFSVVTPVATAQDDDREFEQELETETREITIEAEEDSVEIESKTENESTGEENAFEVEFDADDGAEIKVKFKQGRDINDTEEEVELSYEVEFEELIEFNDADGNGVWNEGEAVSRYAVEDATFQPIDYTTQETENGVTEHVITAVTEDDRFTVTLHAVGAFAELAGTQVRPTEVKIDLGINDYAFEAEDTDLTLLSKLTTEREVEREDSDDEEEQEDGVSIPGDTVRGIFTWKPTATVDGETQPVRSDIRPRGESGEQSIVLSYPRGNTIVHDPRVGFRLTDARGVSQAVIATVLGALLVIGAGAYWLRQR